MACKASLQGRSRHPLCRGARAVCISITPGLRAAVPGAGRALSPLLGTAGRGPRAAATPRRTRLEVMGLGGERDCPALPFPMGRGRAVFCILPRPAAPLHSRVEMAGQAEAGARFGTSSSDLLFCWHGYGLRSWEGSKKYPRSTPGPMRQAGVASPTWAAASVWDQAGLCTPTCHRRDRQEGTAQICSTLEALRDCCGWSQPEPRCFSGLSSLTHAGSP